MNTPEPIKTSGFDLNLDLTGIAKVAKAIPPEVYKQSTKTALKTFESLVSPLTQTTDGVGRLIRQTFDNWVEVRKAIGTYTLEQAVIRAKARAEKYGKVLEPPSHPKTFVRALEEASLETDSVLHEMWVNLLASQLIERNSHPRFVNILAQLGPAEAKLLACLQPRPDDHRFDVYIGGSTAHSGMDVRWTTSQHGPDQPWSLPVTILCQQSLADVSPRIEQPGQSLPVLLHLTAFGKAFLTAVSP